MLSLLRIDITALQMLLEVIHCCFEPTNAPAERLSTDFASKESSRTVSRSPETSGETSEASRSRCHASRYASYFACVEFEHRPTDSLPRIALAGRMYQTSSFTTYAATKSNEPRAYPWFGFRMGQA